MDKKYSKRVRYEFIFKSGEEFQYQIDMDPDTLEHPVPVGMPPDWAKLDVDKCSICPLKSRVSEYCPLALRIAPILSFAPHPAFESVQIRVHKDNMTIESYTTVQDAYRSLIGLIMATSGCPHTAFLKPMARFHLPFASDEEALYRASSMYLLAQYFLNKQGRTPDLELDGLAESYRKLQAVNTAMANRLRAASKETASQAIASLDLFSHILPYDIKGSLAKVRRLFEAYL